MLTVGSLFSGIGGFDLGLERAGMRVIWQSEIDPYASAVLRKHWPTVPNLGDIRGITAATVADAISGEKRRLYGEYGNLAGSRGQKGGGWNQSTETIRSRGPDVLCGGFPCQDISNAGKRAGIDGERSGLWAEFARVIGELRPRYVIVENVAALLGRGIERVLGDLAALGFDAEWHCIPASAVGAPHRRDRVWIIAYRDRDRESALSVDAGKVGKSSGDSVADATRERFDGSGETRAGRWGQPANGGADVANAVSERFQAGRERGEPSGSFLFGRRGLGNGREWLAEPDVGRVAHGVPYRVDRLRCLGNAIVPQIAEIIGRAIVSAEAQECP